MADRWTNVRSVEAKTAIAGLLDGDELVINFDCTQAIDFTPQWAAETAIR